MTRPKTPSMGSTLLGMWSHWCRLVEWGSSVARHGDRPAGLTAFTRERVVHLIEGDLD
jgi:hypothetical protein